jgi:hypothetical protein
LAGTTYTALERPTFQQSFNSEDLASEQVCSVVLVEQQQQQQQQQQQHRLHDTDYVHTYFANTKRIGIQYHTAGS